MATVTLRMNDSGPAMIAAVFTDPVDDELGKPEEVVSDYFAARLGITSTTPSRDGGSNYALAGSLAEGIYAEVTLYAGNKRIDDETIVFINGGANISGGCDLFSERDGIMLAPAVARSYQKSRADGFKASGNGRSNCIWSELENESRRYRGGLAASYTTAAQLHIRADAFYARELNIQYHF